jgi:hypothetical protein
MCHLPGHSNCGAQLSYFLSQEGTIPTFAPVDRPPDFVLEDRGAPVPLVADFVDVLLAVGWDVLACVRVDTSAGDVLEDDIRNDGSVFVGL